MTNAGRRPSGRLLGDVSGFLSRDTNDRPGPYRWHRTARRRSSFRADFRNRRRSRHIAVGRRNRRRNCRDRGRRRWRLRCRWRHPPLRPRQRPARSRRDDANGHRADTAPVPVLRSKQRALPRRPEGLFWSCDILRNACAEATTSRAGCSESGLCRPRTGVKFRFRSQQAVSDPLHADAGHRLPRRR